jgi:hypothetical protein
MFFGCDAGSFFLSSSMMSWHFLSFSLFFTPSVGVESDAGSAQDELGGELSAGAVHRARASTP